MVVHDYDAAGHYFIAREELEKLLKERSRKFKEIAAFFELHDRPAGEHEIVQWSANEADKLLRELRDLNTAVNTSAAEVNAYAGRAGRTSYRFHTLDKG